MEFGYDGFSLDASGVNVTDSGEAWAWQTTAVGSGCVELSPDRLNPCESVHNLISRATRLVVDDVVYVGLLPLLTLVEVVTGVINMAVFVTQGLGDRVNLCLFRLVQGPYLSYSPCDTPPLFTWLVHIAVSGTPPLFTWLVHIAVSDTPPLFTWLLHCGQWHAPSVHLAGTYSGQWHAPSVHLAGTYSGQWHGPSVHLAVTLCGTPPLFTWLVHIAVSDTPPLFTWLVHIAVSDTPPLFTWLLHTAVSGTPPLFTWLLHCGVSCTPPLFTWLLHIAVSGTPPLFTWLLHIAISGTPPLFTWLLHIAVSGTPPLFTWLLHIAVSGTAPLFTWLVHSNVPHGRLSLADFLSLTSMSVRYMSKTLSYVINPSWAYNVWMTSLISYRLLFVHSGFLLVTNLISIVIAVDRWVCVTWPLRAASVMSTRNTGAVITVLSVLIFAGNQILAFKYDVTCAYVRGVTTRPLLYALPSRLYQRNPVLMDTLDAFVFSSLVPTIAVLLTATTTTLTALRLRRIALWRDGAARGSDVITQKEKSLTSMLVVISCVFVICVSPRVVRAWCTFFFPEFRAWGKRCGLLLVTEALMNALLAANSTVNFFVYYTMGSRFRTTLSQLIHRWRRRPPEK
ncbi:hypothetical protein ACOMHN_029525 [Nucella lapillus]